MKRPRHLLLVVAVCATSPPVLALAIPFLALGTGVLTEPSSGCATSSAGPVEAPTIVGPSMLTADDISDWWASTRDQRSSAAVGRPVDELAAMYITEGAAENVRGDIAFAQAVLETGSFTSAGAEANNFAGIRHYDGRAGGDAFPDPAAGVRTHIQLLHKYAAGNDVSLAHPDVAPGAGARAITWADLGGTWASNPDYWDGVAHIYGSMLAAADERPPLGTAAVSCPAQKGQVDATPATAPAGDPVPLATVDGITVHESLAGPLQSLLNAAAEDGVHLAGWGYRSHQRQIELRRDHCGTSDYAIYEMPSSQCSPPTARPGSSMHEQGLAVDFDNCQTRATRCYRWLATHAAAFGLINLPSESWHWSSTGG